MSIWRLQLDRSGFEDHGYQRLYAHIAQEELATMEKATAKPAERTERVQLLMTAEELKGVDDARFDLRIGTRSETIRQLLKKGLEAARDGRS